MARVIGLVFSGFAVRAYGAGLALYVGLKAAAYISAAFGAIHSATAVL